MQILTRLEGKVSANDGLLTASQYAAARGLNPSTVSRQIKSGVLAPLQRGRRRLLDQYQSDWRRYRRLDPVRGGRGGFPSVARPEPGGRGFNPAVALLLSQLRAHGPGLLRELLEVAGGNEREAALATWAFEQLLLHVADGINVDPDLEVEAELLAVEELQWTGHAARLRAAATDRLDKLYDGDVRLTHELFGLGERAWL